VMPTGSGKSFTSAVLLNELSTSLQISLAKQSLCLVPRRKLMRQMQREFVDNGITPRIVKTAQSITDKKLYDGQFSNISILLLDECHELAWWQPVEKLQAFNQNCITIGLTATPDRLSNKQFFEDKFSQIIYPVTFGELVNSGHLCNPRYFSYGNKLQYEEIGIDAEGGFIQEQLDRECEKKNFNESVVRGLVEHNAQSRKSIIFCSSVKQSKQLTEMLYNAGIKTVHVDGNMSEKDQEAAIESVVRGEYAALSCAKLLIAGFDEPRIDTVVLATATNSRTSLIQMSGRGSRTHPDKDGEFWVFDFGDNFARLRMGLKQRFHYKTRDELKTSEPPMKACPKCGTLNYGFVRVCKKCEYIFPPREKPIQDLQELDIIEVEADFADLYHIRNIRKIMRECYSRDELPSIAVEEYCAGKQINASTVFHKSAVKSAIFKHKNLENLLDYTFYADKHLHQWQNGKFSEKESKYLNSIHPKKRKAIIDIHIKSLPHFPLMEFGEQFLQSERIKKYIHKGRWQDALGVLTVGRLTANQEACIEAYKAKWKDISRQLDYLLHLKDGEFNPDHTIEILESNDNPAINDLRCQALVLEWAYKYIELSCPS
jgi:superfamily II DNA or RNA helicase